MTTLTWNDLARLPIHSVRQTFHEREQWSPKSLEPRVLAVINITETCALCVDGRRVVS